MLDNDKILKLHEIFQQIQGNAILFMETKKSVDSLESFLEKRNYNVVAIHGDKPQTLRQEAIKLFSSGEVPILIATDAPDYELNFVEFKDNVYDVIYTNGNNLTRIFDYFVFFKGFYSSKIKLEKWLNSRYVPTPTIIEAAETLYSNHSVNDISQNEAAENLTAMTMKAG